MRISSIAIHVGTAMLFWCGFATLAAAGGASPTPAKDQASDAPRLENARVETRALAWGSVRHPVVPAAGWRASAYPLLVKSKRRRSSRLDVLSAGGIGWDT